MTRIVDKTTLLVHLINALVFFWGGGNVVWHCGNSWGKTAILKGHEDNAGPGKGEILPSLWQEQRGPNPGLRGHKCPW